MLQLPEEIDTNDAAASELGVISTKIELIIKLTEIIYEEQDVAKIRQYLDGQAAFLEEIRRDTRQLHDIFIRWHDENFMQTDNETRNDS